MGPVVPCQLGSRTAWSFACTPRTVLGRRAPPRQANQATSAFWVGSHLQALAHGLSSRAELKCAALLFGFNTRCRRCRRGALRLSGQANAASTGGKHSPVQVLPEDLNRYPSPLAGVQTQRLRVCSWAALVVCAVFAIVPPASAFEYTGLSQAAEATAGVLDIAVSGIEIFQAVLVLFFVTGLAQAFIEVVLERERPVLARRINFRPLGQALEKVCGPYLKLVQGISPKVNGIDISPILSFVGLYLLQSAIITWEVFLYAYIYNQI